MTYPPEPHDPQEQAFGGVGPQDDLDYETALELAKERQAEEHQAHSDPFIRQYSEAPVVEGQGIGPEWTEPEVEVNEDGSLVADQGWFINQLTLLGEDADYNDSDDVDGWFNFSIDPATLVLAASYTPCIETGLEAIAGSPQVRRFQLIEILTPSPEVEHDASLDAPENVEYEEPEPTFLVSPQEYQEQFGDLASRSGIEGYTEADDREHDESQERDAREAGLA